MKVIAFIGSGILVIFGALMVLGSVDRTGNIIWLPIGLVLIGVGLVIIFIAARKKPVADVTNVTYNVDLPGNVKVDEIKCKSCGGILNAKDISMVNGAPMVTCPFCHTVYQFTEEPKW
jgi:hypothetical protein